MKLARSGWRIAGRTGYIQSDLVSLGLPKSRVYFKPGRNVNPRHPRPVSFWERNYYDLIDILKDARNVYLLRMKKYHHAGNYSSDIPSTLTGIWTRIKRVFKQRGIEL